jgi:hypothetical protein
MPIAVFVQDLYWTGASYAGKAADPPAAKVSLDHSLLYLIQEGGQDHRP